MDSGGKKVGVDGWSLTKGVPVNTDGLSNLIGR